jgi:hypothetical protein
VRYLGANAGAGQQHLDGECGDGAKSAYDGEAKQAEQDIGDRRLAQRAEEHDEDSSTGRSSTDRGKDDGRIERDRSSMQILELGRQDFPFILVSVFERLARPSTRSPTRDGRVENTLSSVAIPESRKTGVSATWMICAIVSRADPSALTPDIGLLLDHPAGPTRELASYAVISPQNNAGTFSRSRENGRRRPLDRHKILMIF